MQALDEQQLRDIKGGVIGPDGCIPKFPFEPPFSF